MNAHFTRAAVLVLLTGISTQSCAPRRARAPTDIDAPALQAITGVDPCIAWLIDQAAYDASDKERLKPALSAVIPGAGAGAHAKISLDYVSESTIRLQVDRSKEPFAAQMALAINLAECMDRKAAAVLLSEEFRGLPAADREAFRRRAYEITEQYRTRAMSLILAYVVPEPD